MEESLISAIEFYNQALRFLRCAERCMGIKSEEGEILLADNEFYILPIPTIVNAAFSCELFLKSLLILHNVHYNSCLKRNQRHNLKLLYDLLPIEDYKEFLRIGTKEEFEKELDIHSSDFQKWRYQMEKNNRLNGEIRFLDLLMHNLQILVRNRIDEKKRGSQLES